MRLVRIPRRVRLLFGIALISSSAAPATSAGDRPPIEPSVWTGSGSCAATACHGGRREPLDLKGSEYSFSEAYDPHTRAYSVLFDDRSKRIERSYRRLVDVESARPEEDDACLSCHVHQGYDSKAPWAQTAEFTVADGAGCEGCHGPAGKWLVPHVEYGWKGLSERQKFEGFGMRPTKDLLARGQACAECHVGQGSTDVNHDLIAAGHPRMNFEFGSHLAKLPKHWRVEEDRARNPDYEAKVWALGQLLTAQASLDLLESRASRSLPDDSTTPWPEFAEYSCFSCHHSLVQKGWPSANIANAPRPGTLQWGTWSVPLTKNLPLSLVGSIPDDPASALGSLRITMMSPVPDALTVAKRAHEASEEIGRVADLLNRGRISPPEIRSMLASFRREDPNAPLDWDRAARQYLAMVALDKSAGEFDPRFSNPALRQGLSTLRGDLDLPLRIEREEKSVTFDSPFRLDLERIRADLWAIQAALPNP